MRGPKKSPNRESTIVPRHGNNFLRLHLASRKWVKWWRNPNIEKLLCHVSAGKTLEEWISGVQDSNAVEASHRIGKVKKQPLVHVYRDMF